MQRIWFGGDEMSFHNSCHEMTPDIRQLNRVEKAREVEEQIGNDNWDQAPYMNGYFKERYMFYFDVHYGDHVRTFVELKSGLNSFRIGGPWPIDEKKPDFWAAFLC